MSLFSVPNINCKQNHHYRRRSLYKFSLTTSTTSRSAGTSVFVNAQVLQRAPLDEDYYKTAEIDHNPVTIMPVRTRDQSPIPIALLLGVGLGVFEQHSFWYESRAALHVPLTEALNSNSMHDDNDDEDVASRISC